MVIKLNKYRKNDEDHSDSDSTYEPSVESETQSENEDDSDSCIEEEPIVKDAKAGGDDGGDDDDGEDDDDGGDDDDGEDVDGGDDDDGEDDELEGLPEDLRNFLENVLNSKKLYLMPLQPYNFNPNDEFDEEEIEEEDEDYHEDSKKDKKRKKKLTKKQQIIDDFMGLVRSRNRSSMGSNENLVTEFKKLPFTDQQAALVSFENLVHENNEKFIPYLLRILLSKMPLKIKNDVFNKFENSSKRDYDGKFSAWMDGVLKIPFGKFAKQSLPTKSNITEFFDNASKYLDDAVDGHEAAKHRILQYLGQNISNSTTNGTVMGIEGPMGVGKTTLIEKGLSKIMNVPFHSIPLGSASDACVLNGHSYTYEGSQWGLIVDVLMKSKVMNPIIYFDELDKVSETPKGREIINLLIHLVDPSQNNHFQDRYFGNIDIDMSRCMFIFSYNDIRKINPILKDRIFEIELKGFTKLQKYNISQKYLIPQICKEIGIPQEMINFENEKIIGFIIDQYTKEGGVRKLKECLVEIIREINLNFLKTKNKIPSSSKKIEKITILQNEIETLYLKHRTSISSEKIHDRPQIGRINGLYATINDTGGIIPIETSFVPSDQLLAMSITGNLGKVMQESTQVSKTLAWNLVKPEIQKEWIEKWKENNNKGIHVHCPEGAIEKEGPSAGVALTVAIFSLLSRKKINNLFGVTGEINLSGDVMAIGGLQAKLYGAKEAGVQHVLFPKSNMKDFNKILKDCPDLIDEQFEATPISTIYEAIQYFVEGADITLPSPSVKREASSTAQSSNPKRKKYNLRSNS